jgi:hypothetical protein
MLERFENALSRDQAQNVVQFSADNTQQRTASALDLVSQVASIIRGLQERAAETEARARTLAESALERLRQAETRISSRFIPSSPDRCNEDLAFFPGGHRACLGRAAYRVLGRLRLAA